MNRKQLGAKTEQDQVADNASEPGVDPALESTAGPLGWSTRDLLVPYILLAVSLQRAHGYLIEEYLKSLGFRGIEKSVLYRTLRGLEKDGLLQSGWELGTSGPARRVYALTAAGQTWLDGGVASLTAYRNMIDRFFTLYTGTAATNPDVDTLTDPSTAE